jgi:hypothetical protein
MACKGKERTEYGTWHIAKVPVSIALQKVAVQHMALFLDVNYILCFTVHFTKVYK